MANDPEEIHGRTRFFELVEIASTFVLANVFWAVGSFFIITMPAATAGLFAVFVPWVREQPFELLSTFFGGMRRYWLKSTAVFLINLVIGGFVLLNLLILPQIEMRPIVTLLPLSVTVLVAGVALMTNVYIWPLLILQDLPLRHLLQNALKLALGHAGWTVLVLALAIAPLVLGFLLHRVLFLTASFSAAALAVSWGAWRVIERYLVEE